MTTNHSLMHMIADKNKTVADLEKKLNDLYSYAKTAKAGLDRNKTHVTSYFLDRIIEQEGE